MASVRSWLAPWVIALGALACGAPEGPEPAPADDLRVVLGTGEAEFEPIDGEPRLRLVAGIQGGFHVWASFLVYDFGGDSLDMVLDTRLEDDAESELVMRAQIQLRETLDAEGVPAQFFAGFPAQVRDARCAHDKRVAVRVRLSGDGVTGEDTRRCIAEVDEQQRRSDCQ